MKNSIQLALVSLLIGAMNFAHADNVTMGAGAFTNPGYDGNVTIGAGAGTFEGNGVSIGANAKNGGEGGVAIGTSSESHSENSTHIGTYTRGTGGNTTVVGYGASAAGAGSLAIGVNATVGQAGPDWAVDPRVTGSMAIGNETYVQGQNSVVLGTGSKTMEDNVVSIGDVGATRRLTNLSAGVAGTDGVNVDQLDTAKREAISTSNAYTDVKVGGILTQANSYTDVKVGGILTQANSYTDNAVRGLNSRIDGVEKAAMRGIAAAIAMQSSAPSIPGRLAVGAGVGSYAGYQAVGASVRYTGESGRWSVGGGLSTGGDKLASSISAAFILF